MLLERQIGQKSPLWGLFKKLNEVDKMGFFRFLSEPVYYVGAAISFVLGLLLIGYVPNASAYVFLGGLGGFTIWTAIYINSGVDVIPQAWVYVYEWFGKFRDEKSIANAGLTTRCFPGFIEKLVKEVPLFQREIVLFRDAKNPDGTTKPIDFKGGGSAPVRVKVFYKICANPSAYGIDMTMSDCLKAYSYNVDNPEAWLEAAMDAATMKYLQQRTLDEALEEKGSNILEGLFVDPDKVDPRNVNLKDLSMLNRESIMQTGLEIVRVRYEDTDLPKSIIEERDKQYAAKISKQSAFDQGQAMFIPIEAIINKAKEIGIELTYDKAENFYFKNQGLFTLQKVNTINLFGAGIEDALKSMFMGKGGAK